MIRKLEAKETPMNLCSKPFEKTASKQMLFLLHEEYLNT